MTLAAWRYFRRGGVLHIDSCAMFLVGPCSEVRLVHGLDVFTNDADVEVCETGHGFPLEKYQPKQGAPKCSIHTFLK